MDEYLGYGSILKNLEKKQEEQEIHGRIKTVQATAQPKLVKILRIVPGLKIQKY